MPFWDTYQLGGSLMIPANACAQWCSTPERHGVGKIFLERVGRHAFQTVGIDPVHEFLKTKNRDTGASAAQGFCGHHAGKQIPDRSPRESASQPAAEQRRRNLCSRRTASGRMEARSTKDCADAVSICGVRVDQVHALASSSADITSVRIIGIAV